MTKDEIITLPHPSLRQKSKRVGIVSDNIRRLAADMQAATLDWEDSRDHEVGVALAAVQINQLLRVVVVRNNYDNKEDRTFTVFINPQITKYEGAIVTDYEGCLSIRDIYGKVPRYEKIRVRAVGIDGREFRVTVEGFLARILQHEIDHTNGVVFIDHIKNSPDAFYRLLSDGKLQQLDYEADIKANSILW